VTTPEEIVKLFATSRFTLESEKQLQNSIHEKMKEKRFSVEREVHLDDKNIVDFIVEDNIAIEVKLQGTKKAMYYQCERYTRFSKVEVLLLITNKAVTLPPTINGKKCYTINLSRSWL
jgi:hypothetical protein